MLTKGSLALANDTRINVALGAPATTGLFNITGNLTLDGILSVTDAGGYGNGVYRLFDYGGTLTDNILSIGTLPGASTATVQTSVARQVNLVAGNAGGPAPDILFWDGAGTTPDHAVNGGSGTWNATATNWTNAAGDANFAWGGKFAVFQGNAGAGTVDPAGISATGLQFATGGYRVEGGTITLSAPATLRVGDGTNTGSGMTATIAATIAGSGGIEKTDLGTLILTGSNIYTGATRVSSGVLIVNGSIGGETTVLSGARIGGSGRFGDVTVAGGGSISPGNSIGTLTLTGNYVQAAGSTYFSEINPAGQSDLIQVGGTATLQGGTVSVQKAAGTYLPGTRFTILTAGGGVTGTFAALDQDMPFVNLALSYGANGVFLDVTRSFASFCSVAATRNQCATGTGVQSVGSSTLYNAVVSLPSDDAARAAFTSLSGEIFAASRVAMVEDARLPREAVLARLATAADGNGVWGEAFGNWGRNDGDGNAFRLSRDTTGFVSGIDIALGSDWRVGVAGGYVRDELRVPAIGSDGRQTGLHGLAYVGGKSGRVRMTAGIGYADIDLNTTRSVAFAGFSGTPTAMVNGSLLQGFGEIGYVLPIGAGTIEPVAGYTEVRTTLRSFDEVGGPAALSGRHQSEDFGESLLGLRANLPLGSRVSVQGLAGWRHRFGDRVPTADLSFVGGRSFSLAATTLDSDAATIEGGIDWRVTSRLSFGLRYDGIIGKATRDNSARALLSFAF